VLIVEVILKTKSSRVSEEQKQKKRFEIHSAHWASLDGYERCQALSDLLSARDIFPGCHPVDFTVHSHTIDDIPDVRDSLATNRKFWALI
jgi:hypothetical protein